MIFAFFAGVEWAGGGAIGLPKRGGLLLGLRKDRLAVGRAGSVGVDFFLADFLGDGFLAEADPLHGHGFLLDYGTFLVEGDFVLFLADVGAGGVMAGPFNRNMVCAILSFAAVAVLAGVLWGARSPA